MASDVTVKSEPPGRRETVDRGPDSTGSDADRDHPEDEGLPLDQVFEILRNQRRRYVLHLLLDAEEPLVIGDLAEQIAAWENDKQPHEITSAERKRVYVGLYQAHLPKMDGMGVVSFNKPRGVIEPDVNIGSFEAYLTRESGRWTPPWHAYYAGLSVVSAGVIGAAFVLRPVATVPVVEVAVLAVVAAFSVCSTAHVLWSWRSDDPTSNGG